MTTKAKANMDFSNSAVNLNNNEVVIKDWQYLNDLKCQMRDLVDTIAKHIPPELNDRQAELGMLIAKAENLIRADIEEWGSYQDIELGQYALKQKSEHLIYKPELVKQFAPVKVAEFVLVQSVDQKAMEAMVMAKQIVPADAKKCAEIGTTYRFIVK